MNKWTPGPWRVVIEDGEETPAIMADGWFVASAHTNIPGNPELHNARLIAAAPELADELRHLSDLIDSAIENGVTIPGLATTNKARALLARIKGEQ